MKIHAIHHASYEGLGFIQDWIDENKLGLDQTFVYQSPEYPEMKDVEGLIIMGGPMSVSEEDRYPWLRQEKELIREAIRQDKKVLGICLGAQLVAECLGARVYRNATPEIGWYPVRKVFLFHSWFADFDEKEEETVFHWHHDTFDIPEGAVRLFHSPACENQAFQYSDNILALQFHLEMTPDDIQAIIHNATGSLEPKQFVQHPEKMLKCAEKNQGKAREILFDLLNCFFLED